MARKARAITAAGSFSKVGAGLAGCTVTGPSSPQDWAICQVEAMGASST